MTGVELIAAALAAGATAGVTNTATAAVQDAYAALKDLLAGRLGGGRRSVDRLQDQETDPAAWKTRLGDDLEASGAAQDERILEAAQELLLLASPKAHFNVTTNHGAVGQFHAPVTFHNQAPPVPPQVPGVA